jgi:hypothetical protein
VDTNNTDILLFREYHKVVDRTGKCLNTSESCLNKRDSCNFQVNTLAGNFTLQFYPLYGATNATNTLETLISIMENGTDAIILNHGLWGGENMTGYWSDVLGRAKQAQAKIGGVKTELIWRTTYHESPPTQVVTEMNVNLSAVARQSSWNVLDLRQVSGAAISANLPVYWDSKHFLPFMNDQISDVLLNFFVSLWRIKDFAEVCPRNSDHG